MKKNRATLCGRLLRIHLEVRAPRGAAQPWGVCPPPAATAETRPAPAAPEFHRAWLASRLSGPSARRCRITVTWTGASATRAGTAKLTPRFVLLHLELAQHQLRRLIVSLGARDREDDDLVAGLVLGPSPELEEAPIGQLAAELMQDQRAGYMTFQHLERRDDGDGLRPAECVLTHVARDHDAMDDHVGARDKLPGGDGDDTRRRNRPGGQRQRADDEQQREPSSVARVLAFTREASQSSEPSVFSRSGSGKRSSGSARRKEVLTAPIRKPRKGVGCYCACVRSLRTFPCGNPAIPAEPRIVALHSPTTRCVRSGHRPEQLACRRHSVRLTTRKSTISLETIVQ